MRIHRLETENLNSLYGRQDLDLEKHFLGAPLFLIAGPTGAGKSTLLDAIGLALFGCTPRLASQKSKDVSQDARNVLSRGTGEASATVEFSKLEGPQRVRYRATWYCRRARKNPDGALQDPVRTLERRDGASGEWTTLVSSHQFKEYGKEFERVLEGMTVEDFQRSMLLAQGEFAEFLKGDEKQRISVLERLTRTQRFRDIGARAAEAWRKAKDDEARAEEAVKGVKTLTSEERSQLEALASAQQQKVIAGKAALQHLQACLLWVEEFDRLRSRLLKEEQDEAEARQALEARAADLARLAEHERVQPAASLLADLDHARREHGRLEALLPQLRDQETQAGSSLAAAATALQGAERRRATASAAMAEQEPAIAAARASWSALLQARDELKAAKERVENAQQLASAADEARARAAEVHRLALEEARKAESDFAAMEGGRRLVEGCGALELQARNLRAAADGLTRGRERHADQARMLEAAESRLSSASEVLVAANRAAEESRLQLERVGADVAQLLGASEDPRVRREALRLDSERLAERVMKLAEAQRLKRSLRDSEAETAREDQQRRALEAEQQGLQRDVSEREQSLQLLAGRLAELRQQRESLGVVLALASHRPALKPGAECPLCGSVEHPYAEQTRFAEIDRQTRGVDQQLKEELDQLEQKRQVVAAETSALRERLAGLAARLESSLSLWQQREGEQAGLREKLNELGRHSAAGDKPPPYGVAAGIEAEALAAQLAQTQKELEAVRVAQAQLDALEARQHELEKACSEALSRASGLQLSQAKVEGEVQAARQKLQELEAQLKLDEEAVLGRCASLRSELAAHGLSSDSGAVESLCQAVERGRERAEAIKTAEQRAVDARVLRDQAQLKHETAKADADAKAGAVREHEDACVRRTLRVRDLEAEARQALGGRDPDHVLDELKRICAEAEAEWTQAQQKHAEADREHGIAQTRSNDAARELAILETRSAGLSTGLAQVVGELGLGDEAGLRSRLLDHDESRRLVLERERLTSAVGGRALVVESRRRDLASHEARRPEGLVAGERSAAELRQAVEQRGQAVSDDDTLLQEQLSKLREDDQKREEHQEKVALHHAKRRELEVWERLHNLIGSNDGEQFQRFAQVLNLRELIYKANGRMAQLAPRYRLVPAGQADGKPSLDFAVLDTWHADGERPITTLSGGETFLVSLALALALADYRAVAMPIETLLLDEGFGTLDHDTLGFALNVLQTLNAQGMQIGIISHVEWLKERIEAQVLVEPRGDGRSRVRMTLGASEVQPAA